MNESIQQGKLHKGNIKWEKVREEEKQREKDRKWRFREGEKGRIFERAEK